MVVKKKGKKKLRKQVVKVNLNVHLQEVINVNLAQRNTKNVFLKKIKNAHKSKSRKSRGESPWIKHVKSVAKKENISYKAALKVAGKSYSR